MLGARAIGIVLGVLAASPAAPDPGSVWRRPSLSDRAAHSRRAQARLDQWLKATGAGEFQSIRALYDRSAFRGAREAPGAPVRDAGSWLALREQERRAGWASESDHVEISVNDIDHDQIWISFNEKMTNGRRHGHRRRRLLFQGIAEPVIAAEWEGTLQPGWPDYAPRMEIPVVPRSVDCPVSLNLAAGRYWVIAAEETGHGAALARVTALRAAGRHAEVVLATPPGAKPARFLVVTGTTGDRAAADSEAARSSSRVVEPAQLPAVGRGEPLRLAGRFALIEGREEVVLVVGRTIWIRYDHRKLRRYRLDEQQLTLVSELALDLDVTFQFGERDGAPLVKTRSKEWFRIDPETGEPTPLEGDPPAFGGDRAVVGDRVFTADRARKGIAIARNGAPEAFMPLDVWPTLFAAQAPRGARLAIVPSHAMGDFDVALFEVTAEQPAAGVAKLCGDLIWQGGKGISALPLSFGDTTITSGSQGAYEIWLPANRRLPPPMLPPKPPVCSQDGETIRFWFPKWQGTLLWENGARQTFTFECAERNSP